MTRRCQLCGLPIVLVPSVQERAAKDTTGKTAEYYLDLFPVHARCQLDKRSSEVAELMARKAVDERRT